MRSSQDLKMSVWFQSLFLNYHNPKSRLSAKSDIGFNDPVFCDMPHGRPYSPHVISQSFGAWKPLLGPMSEEGSVLPSLACWPRSVLVWSVTVAHHAQDSLVADTSSLLQPLCGPCIGVGTDWTRSRSTHGPVLQWPAVAWILRLFPPAGRGAVEIAVNYYSQPGLPQIWMYRSTVLLVRHLSVMQMSRVREQVVREKEMKESLFSDHLVPVFGSCLFVFYISPLLWAWANLELYG